jgi:cell division septum initiation protein DivIVA
MTAHDRSEDLVPRRTDFSLAWPGYSQTQVQRYVHNVEKELQQRAADRDAAASHAETLDRQLQALRTENDNLRATVDRISRDPIEPDALQERSRRMIELIREEAAEITERARAAAERTRAAAEESANRLREHYERLLAELDTRRELMEHEHRELMQHAHERIETMKQRAEGHRQHLDQEAAGVRRQAETQFEKAIAFRRSEATRGIAAAERQVGALHEMRIRLTTELRTCRELLADALPLLHPLPDEAAPDFPEQRGSLPTNSASSSRNTSTPHTTTNNLPRPQPAH